jgi:hypothetical protein
MSYRDYLWLHVRVGRSPFLSCTFVLVWITCVSSFLFYSFPQSSLIVLGRACRARARAHTHLCARTRARSLSLTLDAFPSALADGLENHNVQCDAETESLNHFEWTGSAFSYTCCCENNCCQPAFGEYPSHAITLPRLNVTVRVFKQFQRVISRCCKRDTLTFPKFN